MNLCYFSVTFLNGELSGSITTEYSSSYTRQKIPQLNTTIKFKIKPIEVKDVGVPSTKVKYHGGPMQEAKEQEPPFDKPYTKSKGVVTDKSGAKHTPMSRARDLARQAMKRMKKEMMLGKAPGNN